MTVYPPSTLTLAPVTKLLNMSDDRTERTSRRKTYRDAFKEKRKIDSLISGDKAGDIMILTSLARNTMAPDKSSGSPI